MRFLSACLCCVVLAGSLAVGQEPRPSRYFPLNTPLPPPGRAGEWAGHLGKARPVRFQPVQIQLPVEGVVTWYTQGEASGLRTPTPAMAGLLVGPVYRVRLSEMPEYPGVELYPTIEMVDRLHPPIGREIEFPVIIPFTPHEIESAAQGQLVTKIVYLEQPNRASLQVAGRGRAVAPIRVNPRDNPLAVADLHGRPLAIVRVGGRVPDTVNPEPGFFGAGAPVQPIVPPAPPEPADIPEAPEAAE